jgi:hypothetical protein
MTTKKFGLRIVNLLFFEQRQLYILTSQNSFIGSAKTLKLEILDLENSIVKCNTSYYKSLLSSNYLIVDSTKCQLENIKLPQHFNHKYAKDQLLSKYSAQHRIDPSRLEITIPYQEEYAGTTWVLASEKKILSQYHRQLKSFKLQPRRTFSQDLCWLSLCQLEQTKYAFFFICYRSCTVFLQVENAKLKQRLILPDMENPLFITQCKLHAKIIKREHTQGHAASIYFTPTANSHYDLAQVFIDEGLPKQKINNIYTILKKHHVFDFELNTTTASLILANHYQKNKPIDYLAFKHKHYIYNKLFLVTSLGIGAILVIKFMLMLITIQSSYSSIKPLEQRINHIKKELVQSNNQIPLLKQKMHDLSIVGILKPEAIRMLDLFSNILKPLSSDILLDLWLNEIVIDQSQKILIIKGQSLSEVELFELYQNLIKYPQFEELTIKNTKKIKNAPQYLNATGLAKKPFNFTLEMSLKNE